MASILRGIAGKADTIQSSLFSAPLLCIWLLILNYIHPASAILTTCYDPSGNVRPDVPCRQDAVASACCGINWICTNTSLCIAGPKVVLNPGDPEQFEGSCTDISWNSPDCPSFCRNNGLSKNGANGVLNCTGGEYCCTASGSDCCAQNNGTFFLGPYDNVTTIAGAIGPGFFTTTTSSTTPTTLPATTTPTDPSAATSSSPTTSAPPSNHSSGLSPGASAGIGIGVAVVLIACAVGGYFFYMHWSKNRSAPMQFNTLPQSEYYKPQGNMDSFMQQQHPIEMSPNHVRAEMGENQQSIELPAGR